MKNFILLVAAIVGLLQTTYAQSNRSAAPIPPPPPPTTMCPMRVEVQNCISISRRRVRLVANTGWCGTPPTPNCVLPNSYKVYSSNGTLVAQNTTGVFNLPRGSYTIRVTGPQNQRATYTVSVPRCPEVHEIPRVDPNVNRGG